MTIPHLFTTVNASNALTVLMTFITLFASPLTLNLCVLMWVFNLSNVLMASERIYPELKYIPARITMYVIIGIGHLLGFIMMFSEPSDALMKFTIMLNIINFFASAAYFSLLLQR